MTTAKKPFTAFIVDIHHSVDDPFIIHFESVNPQMMPVDAQTQYYVDCEELRDGFDDTHGDPVWRWWNETGAAVIGVIAGRHKIAWNAEECTLAEYENAFNADSTAIVDPFAAENYKTAFLSTAHIDVDTLDKLNEATVNRALPYWVIATEYGWIIRFDTLGARDPDDDLERWLASRRDLMEIRDLLNKHGYQAAHLDQDGPAIEGLFEYEHA